MEMTYTYTVSRVENPQDKIEGTLSIGGVDVTKDHIASQLLIVQIEDIARKLGFKLQDSVTTVTDQTGLTVYTRNAHTSCESLI